MPGELEPWHDRQWFAREYGVAPPLPALGEAVWARVEHVPELNPLAVLAAIPLVVERYLEAVPVTVRSATHLVVGVSPDARGIGDANPVRGLLYQCVFKGLQLNSAAFDRASPPPIPHGVARDAASAEDAAWQFDVSEDALAWLLPAIAERFDGPDKRDAGPAAVRISPKTNQRALPEAGNLMSSEV